MPRAGHSVALLHSRVHGRPAVKKSCFYRLQAAVPADAHAAGPIANGAGVVADATGFDTRYASRHDVNQVGYKRFTRLAQAGRHRPRAEPGLAPVLRHQAARRVRIGRVLGDAAYDAEHNHALCRGRLGIPQTVFRLNCRDTGRK